MNFFILSGTIFLGIYSLIGLWKLGYFLLRATSSTYIEIDQKNFRIQCWLLGLCYWKFRGQTKNISQVKLSSIRLPLTKKSLTVCLLKSKWRKHWFGLFLTQREKEWLLEEIEAFLAKYIAQLEQERLQREEGQQGETAHLEKCRRKSQSWRQNI